MTYAELALTRQPGVGAASSPEGGVKLVHSAATLLRRPPQEPTVYAQIDVTRRSTASGLPPKQEFSLRPPQQPPPPHSLVYLPPTPSPLRSTLPQEDDHLHDAYISAATPLISQQQHADNKVYMNIFDLNKYFLKICVYLNKCACVLKCVSLRVQENN